MWLAFVVIQSNLGSTRSDLIPRGNVCGWVQILAFYFLLGFKFRHELLHIVVLLQLKLYSVCRNANAQIGNRKLIIYLL